MTRNDLETSHFSDLSFFVTETFKKNGTGAGWAASSLISSARLQELGEIQDATWRMITSFNRQSNMTASGQNIQLGAAENNP